MSDTFQLPPSVHNAERLRAFLIALEDRQQRSQLALQELPPTVSQLLGLSTDIEFFELCRHAARQWARFFRDQAGIEDVRREESVLLTYLRENYPEGLQALQEHARGLRRGTPDSRQRTVAGTTGKGPAGTIVSEALGQFDVTSQADSTAVADISGEIQALAEGTIQSDAFTEFDVTSQADSTAVADISGEIQALAEGTIRSDAFTEFDVTSQADSTAVTDISGEVHVLAGGSIHAGILTQFDITSQHDLAIVSTSDFHIIGEASSFEVNFDVFIAVEVAVAAAAVAVVVVMVADIPEPDAFANLDRERQAELADLAELRLSQRLEQLRAEADS